MLFKPFFSFGYMYQVSCIFLEAVLFRSGHCVEAAAAISRGRLLVVVVVCFQERGEVCVSPRLLPPGKLSFAVGVSRRCDAEDADAQVGGNLEAHARAVAAEIQKGEDLQTDGEDLKSDKVVKLKRIGATYH